MSAKTKIFFYILIFISLIFQISKFYSFFLEYSSWQYADWLLNYQGGFVRRGFIGEVLFKFHKYTNIRLDLLVLFLVSSLIVLNSSFLIRALSFLDRNRIDILIFLSPGFFLYSLMNSEVIGRKDILFITFLGFMVFFFEKIKRNFQLIVFVFILYLLSLSHSGFLFYSPYLILLYFLNLISKNEERFIIDIFFILINLVIIFLLIYFNQGNENIVNSICESIKEFISDECGKTDQISWLNKSKIDYYSSKFNNGNIFFLKTFVIYMFSFVLIFIFISLRLKASYFQTHNKFLNNLNPFFLNIFLFFCTLPVFVLGIDWGRYICLSYTGSFYIYIFCLKKNLIRFTKNFEKFKNMNFKTFFVFIFIYSFFWTFPFYNATNIKLTLKKPVISLLNKIN